MSSSPECEEFSSNSEVYLSLLSECGTPELDGSVQGRQRAAARQDPPETRNPSAERAGGAPAGPQEVLLHEVTSPSSGFIIPHFSFPF